MTKGRALLLVAATAALITALVPGAAARAAQPAATDYGAWAWSGTGSIPSALSSALGSTPGAAEAAAVSECQAAGGGTGGNGPCFARVWFEDAFSSLAADGIGAWGVGWSDTSAAADSFALSSCGQTDCEIVGRAQTPSTTAPAGGIIQPVLSYGVWAISPSAQLAAWGVGDTMQSAHQAAITRCDNAGGVAAECAVYGGWVQNGYSAISMGANGSWSFSLEDGPASAEALAQHECQTVKAVGLTCTLKGVGATADALRNTANLGWIDQPVPVPTKPTPTFVCVTGPGGSCEQPGAGVPQPSTWAPVPSTWLTSPVVGGCALDLLGVVAPELGLDLDALDLLTNLGAAVQLDETNGSWFVLLTSVMPFSNCAELLIYILKHKAPPSGEQPDATRKGSAPNPFQAIPKAALGKLKKLPFLRQRIGYAIVELGAEAALARTYGATWLKGTSKTLVCALRHNVYRCDWGSRLKGTRYSGYVLIKGSGKTYQLEKVVRLKG
jgi:Domain of unknown function (DUF4189)